MEMLQLVRSLVKLDPDYWEDMDLSMEKRVLLEEEEAEEQRVLNLASTIMADDKPKKDKTTKSEKTTKTNKGEKVSVLSWHSEI